jgi:hypothetical protein
MFDGTGEAKGVATGATLAPESADDRRASWRIPEFLPGWLTSLVVHLSLVLLLAMVQVLGDGGLREAAIALDCRSVAADEPADADMMAAAIELAAVPAPSQRDESKTIEIAEPATSAQLASQIELVDPSGGLAAAAARAPGDVASEPGAVRTEVFGLAAEGRRFVYVFDRSESMNSILAFTSGGKTVFSMTPLEAAKAELLKSLADLDRRHEFHVLFYNHEVWQFETGASSHRLVPATPEYKRRAAEFVRGVYGHGNTRHVRPLEAALRMRPDVIYLLTDGEEKDDPSAAELARLRRMNRAGTKINVIQFCMTPRTDGALVRLANDSGGRHVFMNLRSLALSLAERAQ